MKKTLLVGLLALGFNTASLAGPIPANLVAKTLKGYAESIGCNFELDRKNIVEADVDNDGEKEFIVFYFIDIGCAGGSGTTRSALAVLRPRDEFHKEDIYIVPELSEPAAEVKGIPRFVDRIALKNGRIFYRGMIHKEGDPNNFPSVSFESQLDLIKIEAEIDTHFKKAIYVWKSQKKAY